MLGNEVIEVILKVLNEDIPLRVINKTSIALIPKIKNLENVTDYRLISLCNVSYKVASKCLANRLKKTLDLVNSENQGAFVSGRQIHDNSIIGFEGLFTMKKDRFGNGSSVSLKLDMAKVYDRVEWNFIKAVMAKLGYSSSWIRKISNCIKSVSFSLLINGEVRGFFIPGRGLRQGDPLSPYLFLFCAESLSAHLKEAERNHLIHGLKFGKGSLFVSHLFFADGSLFFCKADKKECSTIRNMLDEYEIVFGQKVNFEKSNICFVKKVDSLLRTELQEIFGIRRVDCHEKYLGIPISSGKRKNDLFKHIKERVWCKLHGWSGRYFSKAGKEVLIKSVI